VFVISWVNPDERLAQKSFENYMLEGPLAALDAIDAATGEPSVNAVGYCLGGTLLASTLGYLAAHGDDRIASATYFVTLVDFTDVGDMAVFIDEDQIASLEKRMQERGYLEAHDMATSFNMLRANDLIWSFVVNNSERDRYPSTSCSGIRTRPACLRPCTPSICATCTSGTCLRSRTEFLSLARRSICRGSRRRHSCSQRAKITLRHGNRHMRRRDSMAGPSNSSFRPQVTWPA
jgi:hypothetical protein